MADKTVSPGKKAIDYAENQLGVHQVHSAAAEARNKLDQILTDLSELRDKKRFADETYSEAEFNIINDERAKHPDMSQAQMDKHVKAAIQKDRTCFNIRTKLRELASDIDGLEMDREIAETDIKVAVARMVELGGYLNYLAVAKQSNQGGKDGAVSSGIPGW